MITAATLRAIGKLREEGSTSPLETFFHSLQLSVSFNVKDGGRTKVLLFVRQNTLLSRLLCDLIMHMHEIFFVYPEKKATF